MADNEIEYQTYRICISDHNYNIRVNIVYTKINGFILGTYYGYSGGGVYDQRYFFLNEDKESYVSDDYHEGTSNNAPFRR